MSVTLERVQVPGNANDLTSNFLPSTTISTMSLPQDGIPVTEDQLSILSVKSVTPLPDTISSEHIPGRSLFRAQRILELVKRLKALTLQLLPLEVDISKLQEPTSTVITPQVIAAYQAAAGDFREAVRSSLD